MRVFCTICSDLFDTANSVVTTPCGHIFHELCINKWIRQSNTCPDCRNRVTFSSLVKLFFSISVSEEGSLDQLENELNNLRAKLSEKELNLIKVTNEREEIKEYVRIAEEKAERYKQNALNTEEKLSNMRLLMKSQKQFKVKAQELEKTNQNLQRTIEHYQNVQTMINGSQQDVEDIILNHSGGSRGLSDLATFCSLLKRELITVVDSKQEMRNEITNLRRTIDAVNVKCRETKQENQELKEKVITLERENHALVKENKSKMTAVNSVVNISAEAKVCYESPTPERLKRQANTEVNLTSSSEFQSHPFKRARIDFIKQCSFRSKPAGHVFEVQIKPFSRAADSSSSDEESGNIRNGYNGLGGHSKFVSRSVPKVKPGPSNKKK